MSGMPVLSILLLIPVLASLGLVFVRNDKAIRVVTLAASGLEVLAALPLVLGFSPRGFAITAGQPDFGFQFIEKLAWIPQWGINYHLAVDGISVILVVMTVVTLPLCILCSWASIKERVKEFHICLLLMTTACVGVFVAMDLVLFYVFWEAMLIPMYLLIAVWGGAQRRAASIKFFLYTLAGSVFLLAAFAALKTVGGSFSIPELMAGNLAPGLQIWIFLALALAFAVKIPMFPFHTWLPAAHVEAPAAGSVILAAVLLKMGGYGFLRFGLMITPYGASLAAPYMIVLSLIAIVYGGLVALGQSDIKKLVAYSSVAHMGFITLGIFLFNLYGLQGAMLQMLNHAIVTGALFILIGFVYERSHSREIKDNLGLGKHMLTFMVFWWLFSLASFAFPGTNGFVGEILVFIGAFMDHKIAGIFMVAGALLGAAYMLRVSIAMAWGKPSSAAGWKDLNLREVACFIIPALLVLYIGLHPGPLLKVSEPSLEIIEKRMRLPLPVAANFGHGPALRHEVEAPAPVEPVQEAEPAAGQPRQPEGGPQ